MDSSYVYMRLQAAAYSVTFLIWLIATFLMLLIAPCKAEFIIPRISLGGAYQLEIVSVLQEGY